MNKYLLHGKLTASGGRGKQLADILLQAAQLMSSASGCRLYAVSRDPGEPDSVWVTEIWDTREDHDRSLHLPGVRELIGNALPLLDGSPKKGQELAIIGGTGV